MSTPTKVKLIACGSFNPITNMHLRMFEIGRDALHRSGKFRVTGGIISPVSDAYEKKDLVSAKHRCEMIRRALKTLPWVRLDTWECEQSKWSETARVLQHHQAKIDYVHRSTSSPSYTPTKKRKRDSEGSEFEFSNTAVNNINEAPVQLKLLCGADLLESFAVPGLWKDEDIEEIVGQYGLVCITRSGADIRKFIYETDVLYKNQNNIHIVTEWIQNEISATKVRRALRRGESVKYLLQDSVIDYVMEHQLYGVPDNKYIDHMTDSPSFDQVQSFTMLPKQISLPDVLDSPPRSPRQQVIRLEGSTKSKTPPVTPAKPPRQLNCLTDINAIVRRMTNIKVHFPETCV
ncbi:nicotinamide/nicotinic acid mononucleotide adenylyltransferase 1-like [Liolophura sinensis]|uniref:nicotinamide/nicotinic acid mononucleotide adenylyltransferase 1-like n=1 Tax=Liolophura sinensis TaxID=3198878 RepID=UPI003157FD61